MSCTNKAYDDGDDDDDDDDVSRTTFILCIQGDSNSFQ